MKRGMSHRRGGPLRLRAFLYRHVWGATLLFPENVLAAPLGLAINQ
jgi:hypothetical protein